MPKWLHDKLASQAQKQGLKGVAARRYVYGTMNKIEKAHGKPLPSSKPKGK